MYGIVNKVISDYIASKYGPGVWEAVQSDAGLDIDLFVINDFYPDEITFSLLNSASKILNLPMRELKLMLGRHWALDTGIVNAPFYMCSAASDLKTFLRKLPDLHSRVMLVYPNAHAPEFVCTDRGGDGVKLDYYSDRTGFEDYLEGLLLGLAEYYGETVRVRLVQSGVDAERSALRNHSVFEVRWEV